MTQLKLKQEIQTGRGMGGGSGPLSHWWKATVQLERELGYPAAGERARAEWDDLLGRLMLGPCEALYRELMECARLWRLLPPGARWRQRTLLDAFVETAWTEGLRLADYALLAAFRLRQLLSQHRTA
jgi:hypothetical protein